MNIKNLKHIIVNVGNSTLQTEKVQRGVKKGEL